VPPEYREEKPMSDNANDWPLYEIFIRAKSGLDHKHVGSLHATDARMALEHARVSGPSSRTSTGTELSIFWTTHMATSRPFLRSAGFR
jgi:ring-1,2-phenylacetyl-CoA epoxidase subunit PaaB